MFIGRVCKVLNDAHVVYAIVGGYAVCLHGAIRGTVDIDIAIFWNLENLKKTESALKKIGLVSQIPVNAENIFESKDAYINEKNLVAWNFFNPKNPSEQVDLIITYDLKDKKTEYIQAGAETLPILSKSDLIAMKRKCGRPQDIEDAKALENL